MFATRRGMAAEAGRTPDGCFQGVITTLPRRLRGASMLGLAWRTVATGVGGTVGVGTDVSVGAGVAVATSAAAATPGCQGTMADVMIATPEHMSAPNHDSFPTP